MQPDASAEGPATGRGRGRGPVPPVWGVVLALGLVAGLAVLLLDGSLTAVQLLLPVAAVSLMAAGVLVRRPAAPGAWWLLAAGMAVWTAATLAWGLWSMAGGEGAPLWVDAAYLSSYPLFLAGLYRLPGNAVRSRNVGVTLDAMVIVLGAAFVYWTVSFNPYGGVPHIWEGGLTLTAVYPVADLAVLFMVIRLWFTHGPRRPAYGLLSLAFTGLFASDVVYVVTMRSGGAWTLDLVQNLGWLVWFVSMAAAVLHPSAAETGDTSSDGHLTVARGVAFLVAACAGPISLMFVVPAGTVVDPLDLLAPMTMFAALMGFLIVRLITNADTAERRARRLDEQAAELSRALEEQNALQQLLSHRAMHDPLTGLSNRALFTDRLEQATARRYPPARHALLMLDLDGFKHVNDSYGHPVGDQLLIQAGRRLRTIVREADTLARLGGDEFAILLEDVTEEEAGEVAGRVVEAIAESFTVGGHSLHLTASVGMYMVTESVEATDVMRDADLALYAAKAAGKNQISV
ncbi:diguanylate cyclase domain-containing protein, partial [Planomonospora corallina]